MQCAVCSVQCASFEVWDRRPAGPLGTPQKPLHKLPHCTCLYLLFFLVQKSIPQKGGGLKDEVKDTTWKGPKYKYAVWIVPPLTRYVYSYLIPIDTSDLSTSNGTKKVKIYLTTFFFLRWKVSSTWDSCSQLSDPRVKCILLFYELYIYLLFLLWSYISTI